MFFSVADPGESYSKRFFYLLLTFLWLYIICSQWLQTRYVRTIIKAECYISHFSIANKNNIDLDSLYSGISRLFIVDISLDREKDNPQLIFESLNSTGRELSQADLIRNFIFLNSLISCFSNYIHSLCLSLLVDLEQPKSLLVSSTRFLACGAYFVGN